MPAFAAIPACTKVSRGRAKGEILALAIDVEGVAVDQPSSGIRNSSFCAGTNQAVPGFFGCAATAKPKVSEIVFQALAPSVDRNWALWCWVQSVSGWSRQRTIRCGSWPFGLSFSSGGI